MCLEQQQQQHVRLVPEAGDHTRTYVRIYLCGSTGTWAGARCPISGQYGTVWTCRKALVCLCTVRRCRTARVSFMYSGPLLYRTPKQVGLWKATDEVARCGPGMLEPGGKGAVLVISWAACMWCTVHGWPCMGC